MKKNEDSDSTCDKNAVELQQNVKERQNSQESEETDRSQIS